MHRPRVLGEREGAAVEQQLTPLRVAPDHGDEHRERHVRERAAPDRRLRRVEERVVAGARLGDAGKVCGDRERRRRADAHLVHTHAGGAQSAGERRHHAALVRRDRADLVRRAAPVRLAGVGEDAAKVEVWRGRQTRRQRGALRALRVDPGAVVAAVHLEEHRQDHTALAGARLDRGGGIRVVHQQVEAVEPARQAGRLGQPRGRHRHGVRDVGEAAGREVRRLREGRYRDPAELAAHLDARALQRLVRLHVRPQAHPEAGRRRPHPRGVALQHVKIDERRRRAQVPDSHLPKRSRGSAATRGRNSGSPAAAAPRCAGVSSCADNRPRLCHRRRPVRVSAAVPAGLTQLACAWHRSCLPEDRGGAPAPPRAGLRFRVPGGEVR